MKIAILGAGAFGTALGGVLAGNGYDIDYYDTRIEKERLSDVVEGAKCIILCVPSKAVSHVLPYVPKNKPLIVATKGILLDKTFHDFNDWMVLSGPGYADDIKDCKHTHLTATDERIIKMFATDYLDFDLTVDRKGVLMCGALKNIYAIGAGLLNLKAGTKEHEEYLRDTADEMRALLLVNGADPKTVDLNCGIGDLRITCYYPSRNYEYGQKLRENPDYEPENTVEGLSAILRIRRGEMIVTGNLKYLSMILQDCEK